jgi:hypothetical protein
MTWLGLWEEAASSVSDLVWKRVTEDLLREGDRVRMPARLREKMFPGAAERRALTARLGSAGAGLMPTLDEIERTGPGALHATAMERASMEAWLADLRTAARRLEDAWLELEGRVESEVARWHPVTAQISSWRRPLWPVWLAGGAALAGAVWLGLALGGFVPVPAWLLPFALALPD